MGYTEAFDEFLVLLADKMGLSRAPAYRPQYVRDSATADARLAAQQVQPPLRSE